MRFSRFLSWTAILLLPIAVGRSQSFSGMSCTASAPTYFDMRASGVAEKAGDLIVVCSGGTPTPAGLPIPQVNIAVTANAPLTSRILNASLQATEALLLIGDPDASDQAYCPSPAFGCSLLGTGYGGGGPAFSSTSPYNRAAQPLPFGTTRSNAYGGILTYSNQFVFFGVPIDPPGASAPMVLRITNVRMNVTGLGTSTTTAIVAILSVTSSAGFIINNPVQDVGNTRIALTAPTVTSGSSSTSGSTGAISQCTSTTSSATPFVETINFSEAYAYSTKVRVPAGGLALLTRPGDFYFGAESQFVLDPSTSPSSNFGQADLGTRIKVTFGHLQPGLQLFVPSVVAAGTTFDSSSYETMTLTASEAGPFAAVVPTNSPGAPPGYAQLVASNGTAVAIYEVTSQLNSSPFLIDSFSVPVAASYTAASSSYTANFGVTDVTVDLAPNTNSALTTSGPIPRFVPSATPVAGFAISACTAPSGPPLVTIEQGTAVNGTVTVSGWALDNVTAGTAISAVRVAIDGVDAGNATYGASRPDICVLFPGRSGCPNVGFSFQISGIALSAGAHTITVSAIDSDATPDAGFASTTVTVATSSVSVYIDSPAAGTMTSGKISVSGWAVSNVTGSPISNVQIFVDGVPSGIASYGGSRPDVCAAYPGRPNCPNVGFSYLLDTSLLSPGAHTIVASAIDSTSDTGFANVAFMVASAPPSVYVDFPTSGAALTGTVQVTGWALDGSATLGTPATPIQLLVDGVLAGAASYGGYRPDVCAAYPGRPGCPNVGFSYSLNTSRLSPGIHSLTATALGSANRSGLWTVGFTVLTPPNVYIDGPISGSTVSGSVAVSGWAVDNLSTIGTAIASVKVLVDGVNIGNATYGTSRPDVCAAYPGRPGCPNVGFTFLLNAGSLTPGAHTITVTATDTESTPQSGSASSTVTVAAVPPSLYIDSPTAGSVNSGVITVSGWALDNPSPFGTAIGAVKIAVDGTFSGNAAYGSNRADVCTVYPGRPGCPNVGFSYALNTAALTPGSHVITVSATDTDSTPDTGSVNTSINVMGVPPGVYIDYPTAGAALTGTVLVTGWAVDNELFGGSALRPPQVLVDGVTVGTTAYGLSRPDVCAAFPGRPGCPNVGFSYSLNTAGLAPGIHILKVIASDNSATPGTNSWTVNFTIATPPTVYIENPASGAAVSGVFTVSGWAIDNITSTGTSISGVQVKVDGVSAGTATYGLNRPDVCAAFPSRPGCPNVGFSIQLDATGWSPGPHVVTVTATDSDSAPDMGSASVTVIR